MECGAGRWQHGPLINAQANGESCLDTVEPYVMIVVVRLYWSGSHRETRGFWRFPLSFGEKHG